MSKPALLAVTTNERETSIVEKFRDHLDHMLVCWKPKQLASETTMPDSIVSSYQIDKHGISLLGLKRILDVLSKQNSLIHG